MKFLSTSQKQKKVRRRERKKRWEKKPRKMKKKTKWTKKKSPSEWGALVKAVGDDATVGHAAWAVATIAATIVTHCTRAHHDDTDWAAQHRLDGASVNYRNSVCRTAASAANRWANECSWARKEEARAFNALFPSKHAAARARIATRKRDAKEQAAEDSDAAYDDDQAGMLTPTTAGKTLHRYRTKVVQSCVDWMLCAVEKATDCREHCR
jgi:hypothetical protein